MKRIIIENEDLCLLHCRERYKCRRPTGIDKCHGSLTNTKAMGIDLECSRSVRVQVKYWATGKNIESAWTTTFDIVASPILRRHWVPESELVEAFEKEPKKKILDEDAIKEKFPDIDPEQLESLMELCEATHAAGTEQASGTLADTMRLIALTKQNLDKLGPHHEPSQCGREQGVGCRGIGQRVIGAETPLARVQPSQE